VEVSQRSAREGSEGAAGWVRPVCSVHFRKIRITRGACDQGKQGRSQNKKGGQSGSERVRSGHATGGQGKRSKVERAAPLIRGGSMSGWKR